jgi:protein-S-isoprenylcysteine O-methyltransferase Ste14
MNPWFAKALVIVATIVMIAIRAPHGHRSRTIPVTKSAKGRLEGVLLTLVWIGFLFPVLWIATPVMAFADYPLHPIPFLLGALCYAAGLWLFYRSHADLGTNWSITLEVRQKHQLITHGVYRWVRHPMYLSFVIYSIGQALAVPNWIVGPSYGVAMWLIFAFRLRPEERMMQEAFGQEYEAYRAKTACLIPGVW